ncbi:Brix-domain-containing protein [Xylona heveae TC161]|uniref:Ribosome production factor 2 homolog n=1 Tax=Xylona heveae (strain CBS 132557 / TC161) TaxID=1328760 RepID=A0A161TDB7_XYLHT|nr:Brix-domain-containing protein [Xylona heveae TC161]KZF23817.1 Brix-domain-containing protein [Xylona heveae TC161]
MLRQIQPRNARSKRALEKKAPQVHENPKKCLFLRGTSCSEIVQLAMTDLYSLKRTLSVRFTKKNAIHPFEDVSSLEFFSEKNDCSLMVFGAHSKKRAHCMTLVRLFNYKVLDMLELYLEPDSFRTLAQFKNKKCAVGLKPLMVFSGTPFDSPTPNAYTLAKSVFTDFFRGEETQTVDVEGLQYMVSISAGEEVDGQPPPKIHLRVYLIRTKRSGQKLPRVEIEEMGPRMDFRVGRVKEADESMMKDALRKPKGLEPKSKKNVETDIVGDKVGRIHLGKQDLGELQTRKMKGLKRSRAAEAESDDDDDDDEEDLVSDDDTTSKRTKH